MEVLLYNLLFVFVIVFITIVGNKLLNKVCNFYYCKVVKKTKTKLDDELFPLVKRLLNISVWVTGIAVTSLHFGIDVRGLYAGLGISSIVSAMLIKESLINIVAGVTIMFDRPFKKGDEIRLRTGDRGMVLEIGLRRTKIMIPRRSNDRSSSVLIVPNKDISKSKVYNYSAVQDFENV